MNSAFWDGLAAGYHWQLSLITAVGIAAVTFAGKLLVQLVPTFRAAKRLNRETYAQKMENPRYAANLRWNRKWGVFYWVVIFAGILPFCLTAEAQPVWQVLLDCFVILMVYDFFYYLVHRFLFHDAGFLGGPLMWVHAVHHRQHNPCREDSSYIHPLEVAMGLGLYVACIFVLSRFMGDFHVATIVITWVAFTEINLHNHDLWTVDRFPFKYLNTMSAMHHNHHARFTGGNFATISLLYDWMFGTLDYGQGYKGAEYAPKAKKAPGGVGAA
ncbi:sterol desaturase family protein [Novosphingobium album (ex Hu et al. 2023)]|uniref:Sterol desaturase family protein n=1 Tax=Novosphingobium album (ex Hu et al. 2023) TaxID=2930093 RepID=A0ABT0B381_9SPHN|nr:sterol desaturase family protein [Novosphingobium album (ex Hu et al. 2023)]MCJ2179370.1 sterol desaturase family protein [Novosphingobium album (ex Hu et al. 2023)]